MTTEEKAKAYNEAIERAKECITDKKFCETEDTIRSVIEYIFPELAESENGRIREAIESIIRMYEKTRGEWIAGYDMDTLVVHLRNAFTCLEKQKEQKHPNGCFTCDEYKKGYEEGRRNGFTAGYNKAMKEVEQKEQKPELPLMGGDTDTYFDDLRITTKSLTSREWFNEGIKYAQRLQKEQHHSSKFLPGDWVVYDGPLGHAILQVKDVVDGRYTFVDNDSTLLVEDSDKFLRSLTPEDVEEKQKPAEKQDYSGLNDLERAIHRGFLSAGVENIPVTVIKETAKECLAQMKPAGWSENDERVRNAILGFLNPEEGGTKYSSNAELVEWHNWLKSLPERFNLEPKEEWSDEDTEMYINVASSLRGYACGLENEEHKRHIQKGLDWLENRFKSLHPQPKQEWSKEDEEMLTELLLTIEPSDNYDEMRNWLLLKLKSLLLQGSKDSLQTHWKPSENIDIYEVAYERYPINNRLVREVTKDINEDARDGFIDGYKYCDSTRWKPSEEQIEALEYVIRDYREDSCNATANYLQEILDHLKNM